MYKIYRSNGQLLDELYLEDLSKGCWINIVDPTQKELGQIERQSGLQHDLLQAALDESEKSRVEIDDEAHQLLVLVDIAIMRSNKDFDTLPLGIILSEDYIATVCLEPNAVTSHFEQILSEKVISTFKRTRFLFQLLYRSAATYLRYIRIIVRHTEDLEQHLRQSMENSQLYSLLDLQKSLTYFSTSLRSDFLVLERLMRLRQHPVPSLSAVVQLFDDDEDLLDDVSNEYRQALEMVKTYTDIMNSMTELFASIISNNLNLVMKFLASMTIILAIPTLISGMWGMNVRVPFADDLMGFQYIATFMICISVGAAYWLWRKNML